MTQAALLQTGTINLLPNPRGTSGTSWNAGPGNSVAGVASPTLDGVPSIRSTVTDQASTVSVNSRSVSTPALPGQRVTISGWFRGSRAGIRGRLRGQYEGGVTTSYVGQYVEYVTPSQGFTYDSLTLPAAPEGTTYIRWYWECDPATRTDGDQVWIVQPQAEVGDRPTRYVDSTIGAANHTRPSAVIAYPHDDVPASVVVEVSENGGETWRTEYSPGPGPIHNAARVTHRDGMIEVRPAASVALRDLRTDERALTTHERLRWQAATSRGWSAVGEDAVDDVATAQEIAARDLAADTWDASRTLSVIGDMHIGFRFSTPEAHEAADARIAELFADLPNLSGTYARRIYVGDLVELPNEGSTDEPDEWDDIALGYMNGIESDWLAVPGNHDLTNGERNAIHWATVYGMPAKVTYADAARTIWRADLGFCHVIGLTPPVRITGTTPPQGTLDEATLTQLDTWLGIYRKDTIIVCHYPLWGTVRPHPVDKGFNTWGTPIATNGSVAQPIADIDTVLDAHPHARVWLAGHVHSPATAPGLVTQRWTGSRYIACVNAGAPVYTNGNAIDGPLGDDPPRSYFLTLHPDRLEVRQRNHREGIWEPRGGPQPTYPDDPGVPAETIWWGAPVEVAPEGSNPTTMVATFANPAAAEDAGGGAVALTLPGDASYETTSGLEGLDTGTGYVSLNPQPFLNVNEGTVAVRARFTAAAGGSTQYILYIPTTPNLSRIYLDRAADGLISARLASGFRVASHEAIEDTDIHTFAISWNRWQVSLAVDGVIQNRGHTVTVPYQQLETIGPLARLGFNAPLVVYDALLADRELTVTEHALLHAAAGHWTTDLLAVPAVE